MKTKEKTLFWNILRGYAAISIVFGYSYWAMQSFFYAYHIPLLFFLCAGSYNEENYLHKPFGFMGSLFKTYWVKYVFYMVLFVIFHNLSIRFALYSSGEFYAFTDTMNQILSAVVFSCYEPFGGAMWFVLPMIVSAGLLAVCVTLSDKAAKFITKKKTSGYIKNFVIIIIAVVSAAVVSMQKPLPFSMHISFLLLPVGVAAYYITKADDEKIKKPLNFFVALFFGGLIFVLVKYTGYRADISMNVIPAKPWYYVLVFMGIYGCMTLAKYTEKIPIFNKIIASVGRYSFTVVALCLFVIKCCDRIFAFVTGEKNPQVFSRWISAYPEKLWWVYLLAAVVLPVLGGFLLDKIKCAIKKRIEK